MCRWQILPMNIYIEHKNAYSIDISRYVDIHDYMYNHVYEHMRLVEQHMRLVSTTWKRQMGPFGTLPSRPKRRELARKSAWAGPIWT